MSSNFIYLDNNNKLINLSSVDLTADKLTVDKIAIDNNTITMTDSLNNTATFTVGNNGALSIVTTGTAKLEGTTVTLEGSSGVNIDGNTDGNTDVTGTLGVSGNTTVGGLLDGTYVVAAKSYAGYLEIYHRQVADEGIHFSDSTGSSKARLYLSDTTVVHSGTWNNISDSRVKLNQQLADNNILAMAFDNIDLYTYNYTEQYAAENNKSSTNIV